MPTPHKGNSDDNAISQFLTPEAMLTPGVAGSLTMMITNALTLNFEMPRAWVGLGLSFVFGLLVLVTARSILQKLVFYVLNSLVIFCVAAGANGIGAGTSQHASLSLISNAFAQGAAAPPAASSRQQTLEYCSNLSTTVTTAQKANEPPEKILELIKPCQELTRDFAKGATPSETTAPSGSKPFFSPWKF